VKFWKWQALQQETINLIFLVICNMPYCKTLNNLGVQHLLWFGTASTGLYKETATASYPERVKNIISVIFGFH